MPRKNKNSSGKPSGGPSASSSGANASGKQPAAAASASSSSSSSAGAGAGAAALSAGLSGAVTSVEHVMGELKKWVEDGQKKAEEAKRAAAQAQGASSRGRGRGRGGVVVSSGRGGRGGRRMPSQDEDEDDEDEDEDDEDEDDEKDDEPTTSVALSDALFAQIKSKCSAGDAAMDAGNWEQAAIAFSDALQLVPSPKWQWKTSVWILTSMGDALFQLGLHKQALIPLNLAIYCPGGLGNPFLHLRLGACRYEIGEKEASGHDFATALGQGEAWFSQGVDKKYLPFAKKQLKSALA